MDKCDFCEYSKPKIFSEDNKINFTPRNIHTIPDGYKHVNYNTRLEKEYSKPVEFGEESNNND